MGCIHEGAEMAARVAANKNDVVDQRSARYSLILNPYRDARLSKCPVCERPTHPRKFPLVIHIDKWGTMALGKTCRYCARCELITVHQDELEGELTHAMSQLAPEIIGNEYLVLGTMNKKTWRLGLQGAATQLADLRKHMVDFKKRLDLKIEGGWGPA